MEKTNIQALFFDIDGTLVSFRTHRIPQSAVDAIAQAKASGVKVFISTGRPVPFITNLGQISHLIDGYVTTNGAYCFVGSHTVCRQSIAEADVAAILRACLRYDRPAVVVGASNIAVYNHKDVVDRVCGQGLGLGNIVFDSLDQVLHQSVLQVTPFLSSAEEQQLMPAIPGCVSGRWCPDFTDITARGADKGRGLLAMAHYLGLHVQSTMAFGDGGNDISIIRQAGVGVAMGNAGAEVKYAADYVTASVDDDGVRQALQHYGVIAGM